MQRRDLLKAGTTTMGGAVFLAATSAASTSRPTDPVRRAMSPWIKTRDGTHLFYRDWGTGAPVVFLTGWALSSDIWGYQMVPLSESPLRCVAYDRRGHGKSSDPGRGYDYDTLADDLADVLETLELQNVTLVAHSMAGGEAVRYLTRHGSKRIARLVLIGATLPFMTKAANNPDGIEPAVFEQLRRNVLLKDFPKGLQDGLRPFAVAETSTAMLDWVRDLMLQCSMKALIDCNRALTATDFRAELPKVGVATLIIHGDKDVSAPINLTARKLAPLIPGAQLKVYEGAPHGLLLTHAEQLNRDLREFLGRAA